MPNQQHQSTEGKWKFKMPEEQKLETTVKTISSYAVCYTEIGNTTIIYGS